MDATALESWWQTTGQTRFLADVAGGWLEQQRWYGGKSRAVARYAEAVHACLPGQPHLLLVWLDVHYADGGPDQYFMPLIVEPASNRWMDAVASDDGVRTLVNLSLTRSAVTTGAGTVRGFVTGDNLPDAVGALAIRRDLGEQSNSCVRLGDQFLFKVFRRLQAGPNPDFEMCSFLSLQAGYRNVPAIPGGLECRLATGETTTLAMLQPWLANDGNGWQEALQAVKVRLNQGRSVATDLLGDYRHPATLLGKRTAELHLALASDVSTAAFRPEPLTLADVEKVVLKVASDLQRLRAAYPDFAIPSLDVARLVPRNVSGLVKIRCHGDYHLGQVLKVGDDYVILDFEGEPARSLAERRAKHCPLKDVAGMVRSFDYAAQVGLREDTGGDSDRQPLADVWSRAAASAFVDAYRERLGGASLTPLDDAGFTGLLNLYLMEKAAYELEYELNNRPDWVAIPLRGLERLANA